MHSSISSSDFENDYQTLDQGSALRVRVKTFIAGTILTTMVIGAYLSLTSLIPINGRVLGMMDYLPTYLLENQDRQKMLIFGSSMVQAGFEPYQFDSHLAEQGIDVVSINYGVGNLDPEFQQYLTRDVRRKLEAAGQKLDLTLLEFNPFQTTVARGAFGDITRDQNEAILLTASDLWATTLEDPNRGLRLFNIRWFRNGISAQLLSSVFTISDDDNIPGQEEDASLAREQRSELRQSFQDTLPEGLNVFPSEWSHELKGGRINKRQLSLESLEALQNYTDSFRAPVLLAADQQRRILQGDIQELGFDERLIKAFINMVNDLNAVSEHMEVVLLPRNTDWIVYRPEVQQKLDRLMQRITDETGVPVRDFQDHDDITPEMFLDATHLSFGDGIDAYTKLLADTYAEYL
ncbi:MAG: hypothetical protein COB20_12475 [SAR86 cluster bacterium]|uniref:Uncharacterized protein n=1 Tax=SAR86 cluster bacterium TaxID=2030880 RepID=A0A2A4X0L5_9GAMM|nr:MAG: hypothetical protein COB20_12475 [SAR86 cluster bacterium]